MARTWLPHTYSHPYLLRLLNKPNVTKIDERRTHRIAKFNATHNKYYFDAKTVMVTVAIQYNTIQYKRNKYQNYALKPNPEAAELIRLFPRVEPLNIRWMGKTWKHEKSSKRKAWAHNKCRTFIYLFINITIAMYVAISDGAQKERNREELVRVNFCQSNGPLLNIMILVAIFIYCFFAS